MQKVAWRLLARIWLWSLRVRRVTREWLLEYGDGLQRHLATAAVWALFAAITAAPQSVTPQDLDRLRNELVQERQKQTFIGFAETIAWIAAFMGSIYLIKQRGLAFIKVLWDFGKLCAQGPVLLKKSLEMQSQMHGDLLLIGARLRTIEDYSEIATFVAGPDGGWTSVSEPLCEIIGAYPPKVNNHGWKIRIESNDRERVFNDWIKAVKAGEPFAADFYCVHEDGQRAKVSMNAAPQVGPAGNRVGYVGTIKPVPGSGEIKPVQSK
jgi:PAS domain S-box-containing protein